MSRFSAKFIALISKDFPQAYIDFCLPLCHKIRAYQTKLVYIGVTSSFLLTATLI